MLVSGALIKQWEDEETQKIDKNRDMFYHVKWICEESEMWIKINNRKKIK